jgi:2-keto-4-pentenoate hydratase
VNTAAPPNPAIAQAVRRLEAAQAGRCPCAPVRDVLPTGDVDAAYAVQAALIAHRTAGGARAVGRKIGLTSPKVQAQFGVSQPDFGVLLDDMACAQDQPVDITRLIQPKIEAELAFILATDLDQASVSEADVAAATAHVVAALEIVDSRIAGWDISILDTVADNASCGLFVLGDQQVPPANIDVTAVQMTLRRDGEIVSAGTGADCLGSPLAAVAWLARTVRRYGFPLCAGEVVLSGALGPMVNLEPGSRYTAAISGVGTVSAGFTQPAEPETAAGTGS